MELWALDAIFYLCMVTVAVPMALLLLNWNRVSLQYRWLAAILLLSFGCDLAAEVLYRFKMQVNLSGTIWAIGDPILFCWFFYHLIKWKNLRPIFTIVSIGYFIFGVSNLVFIQKFDINTYSNILGKLIIMVFSIVYYYKLLKEMPSEKIYKDGLFLIVSAFFFAASAKLVIFSFVEHLITIYKDNLISLWGIHHSITLIGNLVISYAVTMMLVRMGRMNRNAMSGGSIS